MKDRPDTVSKLTQMLADTRHTFGKLTLSERVRPSRADDPEAPRRLGPVKRLHRAYVVFHPTDGCLVVRDCHVAGPLDCVQTQMKLDESLSTAVTVEARLRESLQRWQLWQERTVPTGWAVLVHGAPPSELAQLDFPWSSCLMSAEARLSEQLGEVMARFRPLWHGDITHLMGDLILSICTQGVSEGTFVPLTAFHESMRQIRRAA